MSRNNAPKLSIALPKGRNGEPAIELFRSIGLDFTASLKDDRRLIFDIPGKNVRALIVRATDIPTYVERGGADIGVSGKDMLAEQEPDLYEPLDLGYGYCRLAVAEPADIRKSDDPAGWSHVRIATKYPNITAKYFAAKGVHVELVKLYGSIELAPFTGIAERIVDLVSTGDTLRKNGLVEVETIMESTARLIVNRASMKTRYAEISKIISALTEKINAIQSKN